MSMVSDVLNITTANGERRWTVGMCRSGVRKREGERDREVVCERGLMNDYITNWVTSSP